MAPKKPYAKDLLTPTLLASIRNLKDRWAEEEIQGEDFQEYRTLITKWLVDAGFTNVKVHFTFNIAFDYSRSHFRLEIKKNSAYLIRQIATSISRGVWSLSYK